MRDRTADASSVAISVFLYRLFLNLYPTSFRREYGPHMLQVFRDYSLRTYGRRGPSGMLSLWALTLLDLIRSMVEQYLQRETFMSRNTLVRLSGWLMMFGGAASGLGLMAVFMLSVKGWMTTIPEGSVWEAILVVAFFYGPVGIGLGMLGLLARFGSDVGILGKGALLLGATVGTALIVIGNVIQSLPNNLQDNGFGFFIAGLFVVFVALELYGILALVSRPQARWNALALIAGLPITLGAIASLATLGTDWPQVMPDPLGAALAASFAIMGVALVMLGYLIQSDMPEEISAAPVGA